MDKRPIGFFDSGVGGVSVLKRAQLALPHEHMIYYGDCANAPYGQLSPEKILELTLAGADFLLKRQIKMLVIACNTATSAAAPELRQRLNIPVVAMEPALKPAQAARCSGQIVVLATKATLMQPRFKASMEQYGANTVVAPVFGLVELVERGVTDGEQVEHCLKNALEQPLRSPTDVIVLGCTHYPFVLNTVRKISGDGVRIIDGSPGTIRQISRLLQAHGLEAALGTGQTEMYSSGRDGHLDVICELFGRYIPEPEPDCAENTI